MSSEPSRCPPEDVLYAFVEGELDDRVAGRIRDHAEACDDCRRRLLDAVHLQNVSNTLAKYRLQPKDNERIARWTRDTLAHLAKQDDEG